MESQTNSANEKSYNCNKTKSNSNSKIKANGGIKYADPLSYNDLLEKEQELQDLLQQAVDEFKLPAGADDQGEPSTDFCERYKDTLGQIKWLKKLLAEPGTPYGPDFETPIDDVPDPDNPSPEPEPEGDETTVEEDLGLT